MPGFAIENLIDSAPEGTQAYYYRTSGGAEIDRVLFLRCRATIKLDPVVGRMGLKPSEALHSNRAAIRRVVESHRARNARIFGSVLRGEDTDSSDLDILIDPTPETTLFDIGAIRHELGKLLGVPVDVLTPNALPDKFRAAVLAEARPV